MENLLRKPEISKVDGKNKKDRTNPQCAASNFHLPSIVLPEVKEEKPSRSAASKSNVRDFESYDNTKSIARRVKNSNSSLDNHAEKLLTFSTNQASSQKKQNHSNSYLHKYSQKISKEALHQAIQQVMGNLSLSNESDAEDQHHSEESSTSSLFSLSNLEFSQNLNEMALSASMFAFDMQNRYSIMRENRKKDILATAPAPLPTTSPHQICQFRKFLELKNYGTDCCVIAAVSVLNRMKTLRDAIYRSCTKGNGTQRPSKTVFCLAQIFGSLIFDVFDLRRSMPAYNNEEMQDASEILVTLLNEFDEAISQFFTFAVAERLVCRCKVNFAETKHNYMAPVLNFYVPAKAYSISFNTLKNKWAEEIEGTDCSKCGESKTTIREMYFGKNCHYLILELHREDHLVQTSIKEFNENNELFGNHSFKLIGAIEYVPEHSHYVSWTKEAGSWYMTNDHETYARRGLHEGLIGYTTLIFEKSA